PGRAHARARDLGRRQLRSDAPHVAPDRAGRAAWRSHRDVGPWRQLSGRHSGRRSGAGRRRHQRARTPVRRLLAARVRARRRLWRDRLGGVCSTPRAGSTGRPAEPLTDGCRDMRADGLLATLDRWGRLILPGTLLLFFVLLTLAPLRAPYLSDT